MCVCAGPSSFPCRRHRCAALSSTFCAESLYDPSVSTSSLPFSDVTHDIGVRFVVLSAGSMVGVQWFSHEAGPTHSNTWKLWNVAQPAMPMLQWEQAGPPQARVADFDFVVPLVLPVGEYVLAYTVTQNDQFRMAHVDDASLPQMRAQPSILPVGPVTQRPPGNTLPPPGSHHYFFGPKFIRQSQAHTGAHISLCSWAEACCARRSFDWLLSRRRAARLLGQCKRLRTKII